MRCGARYKMKCAELHLATEIIAKVDVIKYLGVMFKSGMQLKCTFDHVKTAFYRAFNALYAKCGASQYELTSVFLMESYCIPILTYAIEATVLSNGVMKMLDSAVDNALRKIFKTQSAESISSIRRNLQLSGLESIFHRSLCKFLLKFMVSPLKFANILSDLQRKHLHHILVKYGLRFNGSLTCALYGILNVVRL